MPAPTYPTVAPGTTLQAIQTKVRRLTRSPSEAQLGTDDLNNYINTCVMYDFPEHLRMFNLLTTFTFYANPYQSEYPTDKASYDLGSQGPSNPLYNFQNKYLTINPPVYIAGYHSLYTQDREQLFQMYPKVCSIALTNYTGDGITTNFSGVVNASQAIVPTNQGQSVTLLQNDVLFSSVDSNGNGLSLVDSPILDSVTGNPTVWGLMYNPLNPPTNLPLVLAAPYYNQPGFPNNNFINYATGAYNITFSGAPAPAQSINSQTVPTILALPQSLLYYDNKFVLRPVPDQPYRIQFETYIRPVQLLQEAQSPELEEWWQYLAYLTAKKIFEDRMDLDSVQLIMPELDKQERLCLRRTIVQYTNQRVATIYTESNQANGNSSGPSWGGGTF